MCRKRKTEISEMKGKSKKFCRKIQLKRNRLSFDQKTEAFLVREGKPRPKEMEDPQRGVIVGGQRTIQRVVGLSTDKNILIGKATDQKGVIKPSLSIGKLDHVSKGYLRRFCGNQSVGTCATVFL